MNSAMLGLVLIAASGALSVDASVDAAPAAAKVPAANGVPAAAKTPPLADAPAPVVANTPTPAPANTVACDVTLNVDDPDPKGLNVRATPDAKIGKVIAVLKPVGEWTQVHVTGQSGNWSRIDHAEAVDDDAENGERQVFQGDGWVFTSKLGFSELYVGDGTVIRDRPAREGKVLLRVSDEAKEPKSTKVLGCDGKFIKVQADKQIGWTDSWCTNERTTCS